MAGPGSAQVESRSSEPTTEASSNAPTQDSGGTSNEQRFTSAGSVPPIASDPSPGGRTLTASERAFGAPEHQIASPQTFSGPAHLRVTANGLNVRTSPDASTKDNIVGGVYFGDRLEGLDREGDWIRISYKGQRAYVHGGFVEVEPPQVPPEVAAQPKKVAEAPTTEPTTNTSSPHVQAPAPTAPAHAAAPHEKTSVAHASNAPPHAQAPASQSSPTHAPTSSSVVAASPTSGEPVHVEYELILREIGTGRLTIDQGVQQLIGFDCALHGGELSATGLELVARMPLDALHQQQLHGAAGPSASTSTMHGHEPTATNIHTSADKQEPAAQHPNAAQGWVPPTDAKLEDPHLIQLASQVHDPALDKVVADLAGVLAIDKEARKGMNLGSYYEMHGDKRELVVQGIAAVREDLAKLTTANANAQAFVVAVNHKLEEVAPYHFQLNIKTVESVGGWSTCNLTSLAMALEAIGLSNSSYAPGKRDALLAVAKVFRKDIEGDAATHNDGARLAAHGKNAGDVQSLMGLRLPDFLQLAAVVHALNGAEPTQQNIVTAAGWVVENKKYMGKMVGLVTDFGATSSPLTISWNADHRASTKANEALSDYGDQHRGEHSKNKKVEELNTARNLMERETDPRKRERLRQEVEELSRTQHDALAGVGIEDKLSLDTYKSAVTRDVGPKIDAGLGVIVGLSNHWTRLYAIDGDGIRVQDPGEWNRSEMQISWAEARAMGYFWTAWVIR